MQSPHHARVVVLVLNYNRKLDTIECVKSLLRCVYPSFETIIVDNGSTDGSLEELRAFFTHLKVISTGRNLGYTAGVNAALSHARAKQPQYIMVLNNDTVVEPSFLHHLVDAMEENRNAAIACGTIYCYHDKTRVWYGGGRLISWRGLAIHEQKGVSVNPSALNGTRRVTFVTGCMILFRVSLLDEIGWEDERFFMYLDDIELSARVLAKGHDLLYVPKALIYHKVLGEEKESAFKLHYDTSVEKEIAFKLYYSVRNRFLLISTACKGLPQFVATGYFILVILGKLLIWRFTNFLFFKAACYGLQDFLANRFYEGRGISEFAK